MLKHLELARRLGAFASYRRLRKVQLAAWLEHPCRELTEALRTPPVDPRFKVMPDLRGIPRRDPRMTDAQHAYAIEQARTHDLATMRYHLRDPRFTPMFLHMAATPATRELISDAQMCALWVENQDPTGVEQMVALGAEPFDYAPLTDEERGIVHELVSPLPLNPLLAAIYDQPYEDGPRKALSDFLLAAGDDWGELIATQLANVDSVDEARLRLRHDPMLTDPFGYGVSLLEVDRGFASRVLVSLAEPVNVTRAWSTVFELRFDRKTTPYDPAEIAKMFALPELANVECAWDVPLAVLQRIEHCNLGRLGFSLASELELPMKEIARLSPLWGLELMDASIEQLSPVLLSGFEVWAQGFGWKLHWTSDSAELDVPFVVDDAWLTLFSQSRAPRRRKLRVLSGLSREALEPLGSKFASFEVVPPRLDEP